jgi:hypothetical protein
MLKSASLRLVEYVLVLVAIYCLVYVTYETALEFGVIAWDSHRYIIENTCIQGLTLSNLNCIFTDVYFSNWHPITSLTYAVEYHFFSDTPWVYHFNNLNLHAINSFLVFLLTKKILSTQGVECRRGLVAAIISSVLFAVHPQHVESVAWIAERKGLLGCAFYLLSVLFYTCYVSSDLNRRFLGFSIVCFILSLMSKPIAVTLPVLLMLYDVFPLGRYAGCDGRGFVIRKFLCLLREKVLFFASSFAISVITIYSQSQGDSLSSLEAVGVLWRFVNAAYSLFFYLGKWFAPLDLSPFYAYPSFIIMGDVFLMSLCVIALISVLFLSFRLFIRGRVAVFVVLSLLIVALLPVIGLLQVGVQGAADRYTYLPLIPLYIVAGYLLSDLICSKCTVLKISTAVLFCFVLLSFSLLASNQVKVWRSNLTLWAYVNGDWIGVDKPPEGTSVYQVLWLAMAYHHEGDFENSVKYFSMVNTMGRFPHMGMYVPFAKGYSHLGRNDLARQIYLYMLSVRTLDEKLKTTVNQEIKLIDEQLGLSVE